MLGFSSPRLRRPSPGTLIGVVALVVASGGVAYATIPDAGGVIHSCYGASGSLRVIDSDDGDTCKPNETPLTFNQTGPQGPPGADGADGADGGPGPRGPSDAVASPYILGALEWGPSFATQRSVDLAAGKWVITATGVANNNDSAMARVNCRLRAGGTIIAGIADLPLAPTGTPGEREALTLTGAATLATAGAAELQCQSAASGNVLGPTITAIRVETLNGAS